jgi:hypothetical protein
MVKKKSEHHKKKRLKKSQLQKKVTMLKNAKKNLVTCDQAQGQGTQELI